MRSLLALLLLAGSIAGLRAETYHAWEASVPNQVPPHFQYWLPPTVANQQENDPDNPGEYVSYTAFQSPYGHLFGHLDFSSYPASEFPLQVRFLYYGIDSSELNPAENGSLQSVPDWTSPLKYLAPDAELGQLVQNRQITVGSADGSRAVPVWSITPQSGGGESSLWQSYSVLLEVQGHSGATLTRKTLIESVYLNNARSGPLARQGCESDAYLKSIEPVVYADDLPLEPALYQDVPQLWLDDATLHDPRYTDDFWRRVFLADTLVVGHAAEVQELAQRLGITPNQPFSRGGLWSVDSPKAANFPDPSADTGQYSLELSKGDNPFDTTFDFGAQRTTQLRISQSVSWSSSRFSRWRSSSWASFG
jgi:hypothetical protein